MADKERYLVISKITACGRSFSFNETLKVTRGEESAINFDCVVEAYRSPKHRDSNIGKLDSLYKGAFGFDRYDETTSGKGYKATDSFDKITLKGKPYHIPWLCLWPPKSDLSPISEITTNKEFKPPNRCILYFKINEGNDKKKNKGHLVFVSSSNNLNIENAKKYIVTSKAVNDEFLLHISCTGVIKQDATITIYETSETGKVVGMIKVIANDTIGIAKVHFVPIEYEITTTSKRRQEKATEKTKEFNTLVNNVLTYLNKEAFNQSLIFITATKEKNVITVPKKIIETKNEGAYSASVSKAYFDGIPDKKEPQDNNKKEVKILDKAIRKYYSAVQKKHNKLKRNTLYCYDTMGSIDIELKKNYEAAYKTYLATLGGEVLINNHKKKEDTIYVFIHKDINTLNTGGFEYQGYAYHGGNNAFVFNKPLKNKNYGVFAHEIAHVMGLDHTFELNAKDLNKKVDKAIKDSEKELKNKDKGTPVNINKPVNDAQELFEKGIKDLNTLKLENKETLMDREGWKEGYYYQKINTRFEWIEGAAINENKFKINKPTINPLQQKILKIENLKKEKKENLKKVIDIEQSYTQENFMDYNSLKSENSSNSNIPKEIKYNENFHYKSFWKWQSDKMKASNFITLKKL